MNPDHQDFEDLRKLMALKRHEQPPPEYLNKLSSTIITRIERGEGQPNLWDRISTNFSLRPSVAYAFGLTVCGALGFSAVYLVHQEMTQPVDTSEIASLKAPIPASTFASQMKPAGPTLHVANWLGNTNPTAETQPEISLFNTTHAVVPVSYSTGN